MSRLALAGLAFVVFTNPALAFENASESTTSDVSALLDSNSLGLMTSEDPGPMPLVLNATGNGFEFDLGGSDKRKLHLYINAPVAPDSIGLGAGSQLHSLPGSDILGLNATLNMPVSPSFSLTGNIREQREQAQFQPVGSIQCTDGILRPHSYTASGCRFVDDSYAGIDSSALNLGAQFNTPSTSTAISWFTSESEMTTSGAGRFSALQPGAGRRMDMLSPMMTNPLLPAAPLGQPLSNFEGEASGVDLSFQLGLSSDGYGDVHVGLAYSRILDADFSGLYSNLTPLGWRISDDYDTARMDVEWRRGSFSGGIQGYYREQVDFLNRQSLDSLSTFDVHFTWRTPWNADLSVGASNILNAGSDEVNPADNQSTDPFESIYGRIPYVRYKQDL